MSISKRFCDLHHLEISVKKSKIMSYESSTGKATFGNDEEDLITLDQVIAFKYLGVTVSSKPRGLFKDHNENAKAKARQYLHSVLSLVKT